MNSKMTTKSQLSTSEPRKKNQQAKQTTRTGTESQKWRSHGGLSAGGGGGRFNDGGRGGAGWRGIKGRKKWDNCNSIINILKINTNK